MIRFALVALLLAFPAAAADVRTLALLSPYRTSVLGGESRVYSVRALDVAGQPVAGQTVTFQNDACGNFDNGQFNIEKATDATGAVSVTFTARAQGITCWIT